ncbi:MAG: c-type cytochrome [Acidobacteriia bacterium]|nr:c-type cytochrome [Terriglobia bacterium]
MRILFTALFILLPLCAQEKQENKEKKGPPRPPQNLKVLKVTDPREVGQIMRTFTAGLGVQCNYCHVQDRASDENPKKEIARHMIQMSMDINKNFPDGKMHVTCYTCHRGEAEPKTAPEAKPAQ